MPTTTTSQRLDTRIKKLDNKLADVEKIKPVDAQHKAQIDATKHKLLVRREIAIADKKAIDKQLTTYADTTNQQEKISREADKTHWEESMQKARHEQLKKYYGEKYPGSYNAATNTIDALKWSQNDVQNYERSRKARNDAIIANRKKQKEAKDALVKRQEAAKKYAALKKKTEGHFAANNDLSDPCVPCLSDRQKKLDRIKAVFPGQQSFGNCGIQSSAQIIQLASCEKTDETALLKESLKAGDAELVRPDTFTYKVKSLFHKLLNPGELPVEEELAVIDAIKPVRDSKQPVNPTTDEKGTHYERTPDEAAEKHNESVINTSATGGASSDQTERIMARHGTRTTQQPQTLEGLSKAIKNNQPVRVGTEASKLQPAYDENGKKIETWKSLKTGKALGSGPHDVVVADGKFDKNGKLTHVLVSDTGCGKIYYMKAQDFKKAFLPGDTMAVSDKPINMNCP